MMHSQLLSKGTVLDFGRATLVWMRVERCGHGPQRQRPTVLPWLLSLVQYHLWFDTSIHTNTFWSLMDRGPEDHRKRIGFEDNVIDIHGGVFHVADCPSEGDSHEQAVNPQSDHKELEERRSIVIHTNMSPVYCKFVAS